MIFVGQGTERLWRSQSAPGPVSSRDSGRSWHSQTPGSSRLRIVKKHREVGALFGLPVTLPAQTWTAWCFSLFFPEGVVRVPVSLWGIGVPKVAPSATVCVSAVTLSTAANAAGRGLESVSSWLVQPQLYWRLQRKRQCEWSVAPQLYWRLQRKRQCEWSVAPHLFWRLQRRCLCEWSVSPQLYWSVPPQTYWRLQRRCLCERSVSPQLYWRLQRKRQCEWSVAPHLFWRLQRKCQCERPVAPQFYWRLQRRCQREWSCRESVSCQSVLQKCQVSVSTKRVKPEFPTKVLSKSALQECQSRVPHKSVK